MGLRNRKEGVVVAGKCLGSEIDDGDDRAGRGDLHKENGREFNEFSLVFELRIGI
jgi:hypothetical protein